MSGRHTWFVVCFSCEASEVGYLLEAYDDRERVAYRQEMGAAIVAERSTLAAAESLLLDALEVRARRKQGRLN